MKTVKRISALLLCIAMLITINIDHVEAKANVKLSKTKVTLTVGKTSTLKLVGSKVKKWSTSNKKIATVSSNGKITAKKVGTAIVTAKSTNGKVYKCTVTVSKKPSATYSDSEVMSIVENTLRGARFVKTTEYMTPEELEEWGPTAGCGWGENNVSNTNPQADANKLVEFMNSCGYNMYYIEKVGSVSGGITIRLYRGTY